MENDKLDKEEFRQALIDAIGVDPVEDSDTAEAVKSLIDNLSQHYNNRVDEAERLERENAELRTRMRKMFYNDVRETREVEPERNDEKNITIEDVVKEFND